MGRGLGDGGCGSRVGVGSRPPGDPPRVLLPRRGGGGDAGSQAAGPHRSTTKVEALWLTEAECSAHRPLGSSRVWTV